ncbi:solute carrier family 35 member B1 isoform X2 [Copidosoma floridanum]|uniref:solute carrier family 35 member B1 isoform X2 n=1 Tax=Copidosoma floridanum TaxID=29053 RepID=UPI000C6F6098|nr:solute carrier family 35 member B1 isoform X2 [Copidosoma floridanum]
MTQPQHHPSAAKLVFCALGIFVCYSYLVFVQCVVNCLFAKGLLVTVMKQGEDTTRVVYYACSALMYLLAMVCSNMALQFINYPTQVVGKAGKPIPVMIFGVLLGGKTYPFKKYCFITLIVTGVVLFMYKENAATNKIEGEGFGQVLLLLSLTMDSLISAVQNKMQTEHKTKSGHMMFNMNLWSILYSGAVILVTGEFLSFLKFLQRHPSAIQHIFTLSICGALGQYFIFLTISEFSPLTCSIMTTTRKCFTVVASIMYFGNSLLPRQWFAAFMVFFGLFLDAFYGRTKIVKKEAAK